MVAAEQQLFDRTVRAGFGTSTPIHAVGDGTQWLADQVKDLFGCQGSYLLGFYHVCGYLSAAQKCIVKRQGKRTDEQKHRLKTQRVGELINDLATHLEGPDVDDSEAPVRQCHRNLDQRHEQLHYESALVLELPIGSALIESAHRYIVQQRLKRPGARWCAQNAKHLWALRRNRANRQRHEYWATEFKQAA